MAQENTPTCSICLSDTNDPKARCGKCGVLTCSRCWTTGLCCLCPICDRKELNTPWHCSDCNKNVHVSQFMVYWCGVCKKRIDQCGTCYDAQRGHNEASCLQRQLQQQQQQQRNQPDPPSWPSVIDLNDDDGDRWLNSDSDMSEDEDDGDADEHGNLRGFVVYDEE